MTPSGRPLDRSATSTSKPSASARPLTIAMVCGRQSASRTVLPSWAALFLLARRIISTASATAVASSSSEALAIGRPTRSWTMVWKFSSASSRPWEISGWYGRVGGVPGRGLEDVAADHRRGDGVVVALADHLHGGLVLRGELAQFGEDLDFAEGCGERERRSPAGCPSERRCPRGRRRCRSRQPSAWRRRRPGGGRRYAGQRRTWRLG